MKVSVGKIYGEDWILDLKNAKIICPCAEFDLASPPVEQYEFGVFTAVCREAVRLGFLKERSIFLVAKEHQC